MVEAGLAQAQFSEIALRPIGRTDAGGQLVVMLAAGTWIFRASTSDELGESPVEVRAHREVVLVLRGVRAVTGTVYHGATSAPVAGAVVTCHYTGGGRQAVAPLSPCTTGPEGRFRFLVPPGMPLSLRARLGNEWSIARQVGRGEQATDVVLYIGDRFSVRIRLVDPDGRPVSGGIAGAFQPREGQRKERMYPATERGGVHVAGVPSAGTYGVRGEATGFASGFGQVAVAEAVRSPECEVRLLRPLAMAGRVQDESGRGLAKAWLLLREVKKEGDLLWFGMYGKPPQAQADEAGCFELIGLHPRATYLLVVKPWEERPGVGWQKVIGHLNELTTVVVPMRALGPWTLDVDVVGNVSPGSIVSVATRDEQVGSNIRVRFEKVSRPGRVTFRDLNGARAYRVLLECKGEEPLEAGPLELRRSEVVRLVR